MAIELIIQSSLLGVKCYIGLAGPNQQVNEEIISRTSKYIEESFIINRGNESKIFSVIDLHNKIVKNNIDIVHSHKYKTNFLSIIAKHGTPCRLVSTCHNWIGKSAKMKFYEFIDKFIVLPFFDATVGVSHEVTEQLNQTIPKSKIFKVENGVDLNKFKRRLTTQEAKKLIGINTETYLIGFVGRLAEDKGVAVLLKAASRLIKAGKNISVIIIGEGPFRDDLHELVKHLNIDKKVLFTGNQNDTPLFYSALDLFVLPSLLEAFPMVVLEAMACGVPVIATKVGDVPIIIEDNVNGIIIPPEDEEVLSNQISSLLSNPDKTRRLSKQAFIKVKNQFTSRAMTQKYLSIYQQVKSVDNPPIK